MFKHKDLAFFDIKLKSQHKNVVLVKGNDAEVDQIPFEGSIKLSTPDDLHVRKIKLKLVGEYHVEFLEKDQTRSFVNQVYDHLCTLKVVWNNLLTSPDGEIQFGDYGDTFVPFSRLKKPHSRNGSVVNSPSDSPSHSLVNIAQMNTEAPQRPVFGRTSSQPVLGKHHHAPSLIKLPKSGIDGTPFKNETHSAHHSYLLPKGNYNIPFKIFLPTNVCETVEGLNPGKLMYRLECSIERGLFEKAFTKAKHVRIIRTLHPQSLNLTDSIDINNTWPGKVQYNVCLQRKGLALGALVPITLLIVPIAKGLKLKGVSGVLVEHYHVSHSEGRSPEFEELFGKQTLTIPSQETLGEDKWEFRTHFKVPDNLKNITQTCDLKNNMIQVRHRLRISIQLKNKTGHVSELRANLPVHLYISPSTGNVVGRHFDVDMPHECFLPSGEEEVLFKRHISPNHSAVDLTEEAEEEEDDVLDRREAAPPLYQQHVYDMVYDSNLPQSPYEQFRLQSAQNSPINSTPGSLANLSGYFDMARTTDRNIDSCIDELSRTPKSPNIDVNLLLKVPSYDQAVDEDDEVVDEDLAPKYDDDDEDSKDSSNSSTVSSMKIPKNKSDHHLFVPRFKGLTHSPAKNRSTASLSSYGSTSDLRPSLQKIHGVPKMLKKKQT